MASPFSASSATLAYPFSLPLSVPLRTLLTKASPFAAVLLTPFFRKVNDVDLARLNPSDTDDDAAREILEVFSRSDDCLPLLGVEVDATGLSLVFASGADSLGAEVEGPGIGWVFSSSKTSSDEGATRPG